MYASAASFSARNANVRRTVTYHPSVWGDHFLSYTTKLTETPAAEKEELERQKEKVKKLLEQTPDDSTLKIELLDAIQRLGVGYHFEKEIKESLQCIHDTYPIYEDDDLRVVALRFRLLRQNGYHAPCDVFRNFIDEDGNFMESLINDVEGMLNLYEASNFGVNGEEILDKALQFSSSHLQSLICGKTNSLSTRVNKALKTPISKTLTRLGAKKFIPVYQEDDTHNEILLKLAQLDFNIVQKLHQKELRDITRWWKDLDLSNKLPFARDRIAECYFWILGVYFEPHYTTARRILTKVICMTSIIDDIYDVYGTLDELQIFTNIIQCWDINDVDKLPPYMRICFKALFDVYAEMEDEMINTEQSYRVQYSKEEMKKLTNAYFEEAKWSINMYMPTMEEYIKVGLASTGYAMLSMTFLVGMEDHVTKEDFEWVSSEPPILRASLTLARLMDDLAGYGFEQKVTAIDCYMNQYSTSEKEAFTELERQVKKAWKDINKELMEPKSASTPTLMSIVNLTRVLHFFYVEEDGYSNSKTQTKDSIRCVLVEPVTI